MPPSRSGKGNQSDSEDGPANDLQRNCCANTAKQLYGGLTGERLASMQMVALI